MMGKMKNVLYMFGNAAVLAGLIILLTGFYYEVVKAGIPYQDPTLELQIQYAVNLKVGDELCRIGFLTVVYGIVLRLILWLVAKKNGKF